MMDKYLADCKILALETGEVFSYRDERAKRSRGGKPPSAADLSGEPKRYILFWPQGLAVHVSSRAKVAFWREEAILKAWHSAHAPKALVL